jgi:hypothetical protein
MWRTSVRCTHWSLGRTASRIARFFEAQPRIALPRRDPSAISDWERIGIARGIDQKGEMRDANFCHDRRMAGYDGRLLRPAAVPRLATLALRLCKLRK